MTPAAATSQMYNGGLISMGSPSVDGITQEPPRRTSRAATANRASSPLRRTPWPRPVNASTAAVRTTPSSRPASRIEPLPARELPPPAGGRTLGLEEATMTTLFEPPVSHLVAALLLIAGASAAVHSARLVGRGLRAARSLDIIRGIRMSVLALV